MEKTIWILSFAAWLAANPVNPLFVQGEGEIREQDQLLEIKAPDRSIIDWLSFSIASNETTRFIQPDTDSTVLNRVLGITQSHIEGTLEANGRVILVNPNGIIVSPSGVIQASEFITATFDLVDKETWALSRNPGEKLSGAINMDGIIRATGMKEENGSILLIAENVDVKGELEASNVALLGDRVSLDGRIDGKNVLLGGDYQGANPEIRNASITYMGRDALICADGIESEDGGKVILWSDGDVYCYGQISSRGGREGGNGGLVEISGQNHWDFRGKVDLSGVQMGTLLLDPSTININNVGPTSPALPVCPATVYNPAVATATILDTDLSAHLDACSIVIQTTAGAGGTGDITVFQGANVTWTMMPSSLTIVADGQLSIQGQIFANGVASPINLSGQRVVVGDPTNTQPVLIESNGPISLNSSGSMFILGGNGGGTVDILNDMTAPLTLNSATGDILVSSITSADNITIGSLSSGPLHIIATGGNFLLNAANNASVTVRTDDFLDLNVARNWQIQSSSANLIKFDIASTTGNPSNLNVGNDFLADATGSGAFLLSFQFSFPTANIGHDMRLTSSSTTVSQIQPMGIGGLFDIGNDFFMNATSTGAVNMTSNLDLTMNIGGSATILNNGPSQTTLLAVQDLFMNIGGDLFI
ncbi:MAG: filamentous hemagglutinin N-terminal domain-containing protein [Parachlamydiales bacterium]|nr:filamentous hemagglutinin N-terminal domain-containing protein [Parachlamydiales bacterium]